MLIKNVKIDGFGKLLDKSFSFKPGLNIIFGKNESGKTTLAKFLLYTLSSPTEDAEKFKPWHSDKFGGIVDTSEGEYTFSKVSEKNFQKSTLETISFIFEDDNIDTIPVEKGFVKSSLKKKTEKTGFGIAITTALDRLKQTDFNSCLLKYSEEMKKIENNVEEIKFEIGKYNDNILQLRELKKELKDLEERFLEASKNYEEMKNSFFEKTKQRLSSLLEEKKSLEPELKKYERIDKIPIETINELQRLFLEQENIVRKIEEIKSTIASVKDTLEDKVRKINERLGTFGITSEKDLENVHLRLKHLSLLAKMYVENQQKVVTEDPLWKIFLDNKNIVDQYEDELQKMKKEMEDKERELKEIEKEIDKHTSLGKIYKDLTILSFIVSIGIFAATFLLSPSNIILFGSATLFSVLGIIIALGWRKSSTLVESLEERFSEVSMRRIGEYPLVKILNKYNINSVKDLRKRYEEFIEWKAKNKEQQKIYEESKEIEAEIIRELSKFNVTGATQMLVSAVERLQQQFNDLQELVYEKNTIERKLVELGVELSDYQKQYAVVNEKIEQFLNDFSISREDIYEYENIVKESLNLKERLSMVINEIKEVENTIDNSLLPKEISAARQELEILKSSIDNTKTKVNDIEKVVSQYSDRSEELKQLMSTYDELYLKMVLLRKIVDSAENVRKHFEESLKTYSENYLKKFSEELNNTINRITSELKNFVVLDDLSVRIAVSGELLYPENYLSNSTRDLLVFAFKRAFYKALYSDNLPLIIDNSLVRFDDDRLKKVCEIINDDSIERQIIILTSDTRLLKIFENSNVIYLE